MYYTVEKEVRIKTAVVSLWFDVAHPTESLLEAIKVCQGGNGGRETIPVKSSVQNDKKINGNQSLFQVLGRYATQKVRKCIPSLVTNAKVV